MHNLYADAPIFQSFDCITLNCCYRLLKLLQTEQMGLNDKKFFKIFNDTQKFKPSLNFANVQRLIFNLRSNPRSSQK